MENKMSTRYCDIKSGGIKIYNKLMLTLIKIETIFYLSNSLVFISYKFGNIKGIRGLKQERVLSTD